MVEHWRWTSNIAKGRKSQWINHWKSIAEIKTLSKQYFSIQSIVIYWLENPWKPIYCKLQWAKLIYHEYPVTFHHLAKRYTRFKIPSVWYDYKKVTLFSTLFSVLRYFSNYKRKQEMKAKNVFSNSMKPRYLVQPKFRAYRKFLKFKIQCNSDALTQMHTHTDK